MAVVSSVHITHYKCSSNKYNVTVTLLLVTRCLCIRAFSLRRLAAIEFRLYSMVRTMNLRQSEPVLRGPPSALANSQPWPDARDFHIANIEFEESRTPRALLRPFGIKICRSNADFNMGY